MPRLIAEDLKHLSIYKFKGWGLLSASNKFFTSGELTWSRNGEVYSKVGYSMYYQDKQPTYLNLDYKAVDTGERYTPTINISQTIANYGGHRYWFDCPLCNNRCAKLFFYDFRLYCRRCLNLSYECNNTSKYYRALEAYFGGARAERYHEHLLRTGRYTYANQPTKAYKRYMKYKKRDFDMVKAELLLTGDIRKRGRPRR